jgi:hydroxymethylpyrimidine/phosphomethylpyrimidine kinase
MQKPNVLTIAGSDPSGGAGVQADIKSFQCSGAHGLSVITCVTAQNTQGVKQIFPLPLSVIESQIDSVFEDCIISAVKIGMLYNGTIVDLVGKKLTEYQIHPIVDPVIKSTYNEPLSDDSLISSMKKKLLPESLVVTPNIYEASVLSDTDINSVDDMVAACPILHTFSGEFVVIKGGHLNGKTVVDVIYDGKKIIKISNPRFNRLDIHGSGCNFAALLTSNIASGNTPITAIKLAKQQLWNLFPTKYSPGKGSQVIDYSSAINLPLELSNIHLDTAIHLQQTITYLLEILPSHSIPEVGINICYALPQAQTINDICGINGRIITTTNGLSNCGKISFGASKHIAKIVLTVMQHNPQYRSAMNIAYSPETVKKCTKVGLTAAGFSREHEPTSAPSSMEWGTNHAIIRFGRIPDIIYDTGSQGKEAMIRILGENPRDMLKKVQKII